AIAAVVMVVCRKREGSTKYLIRRNSFMAILLAFVVVVNLICWGPMSNLISLATGSGTISQETSDEATDLCTEIAEEGIVLLKNDSDILPLKNDSNLNVFGWASTNPCYGGTGSGSLSDAYETISLLQGLTDAGFKLNTSMT
ncbi:beta-glucosidase, partial [Weissella cibaria]|nr:beta-glucosidase [Weissella cibaria]